MSEQKILVLAGSKQSGKSSTVNFLHGHIMKKEKVTSYFDINDDGQLLIAAPQLNENGQEEEQQGIMDINQKGYEFEQWASYNIWPYVKSYNFADKLKIHVCDIFGINPVLAFGSNEDKNTLTSIKFSDIAFSLFPKEIEDLKKKNLYHSFMTIRQFLQNFGTRICRRIQDGCWIDRLIEQIIVEACPFALVGDGRFPNEVVAMRKIGAKVIKFTRKVDEDSDESETALDDYQDVDIIIDNSNMTVHEKNIAVFEYLKSIGWVEGDI